MGKVFANPSSSHTKDSKNATMMPPFLTLSIIRYKSRVKWSNPEKGVVPCPTPRCHHHHVALSARIFLTLSRHISLLSITSGRSSRLHPILAQSCCMSVRAGCPAFARPCEGVHRSTSLMSSSLLLQQCPTFLTSHHPSQTPCLPWISYATQKLMLNSCKMVEKQSEAFHTFLWQHFFQV